MRVDVNIPRKANKILNLILLAFLLILIRVGFLEFAQREYHDQQARRPKRRSSLESVERATIRDRFNLPLAQNAISYNAAVRYADIREIPSSRWMKGEDGVRRKTPIRGPYITSLSQKLADELNMDPRAIEDTIYAKASMFPHTPFILQENLSEKQYYRLRMMQKDWRGVEAQRVSQRVYPRGKTACDILGYMGAISSKEYVSVAEEIKTLQDYIKKREMGEIVFLPMGYKTPMEVRRRLKTLQEKAYRMNDQVGKAGIEKVYDEILRGAHGKTMYEMDPKGNIIRELPGGIASSSGQKVSLAISAELQEFAEGLLAEHEFFRDPKDKQGNLIPGTPWIKGGAVVAMKPKTGEILALASYPRFDPNDFVPAQTPQEKKKKQPKIEKWLESERYISDLFEGKAVLTKERFDQNTGLWSEESQRITWEYYLSVLLPPESYALKVLKEIQSVESAYCLLHSVDTLLKTLQTQDLHALVHGLFRGANHIKGKKRVSEEACDYVTRAIASKQPEIAVLLQNIRGRLEPISHNDDKVLVLDLLGLLVDIDLWDEKLVSEVGFLSLSDWMRFSQAMKKLEGDIKESALDLYHSVGFDTWRQESFKEFLKQRRQEEKLAKRPAKPYTDYLEAQERLLSKQFWQENRSNLLEAALFPDSAVDEKNNPYLCFASNFTSVELSSLRKALASFSKENAQKLVRCVRGFDDLTRPLWGKYRFLRHEKGLQREKHLAAAFYPLLGFGYGRSHAFRETTPQGSVFKIVVAYEALKQKYLHLKENGLSLKDLNPLTLVDLIHMNTRPGSPKQLLGFTEDGEPIHRLYKGGMLPRTHPNIGRIGVEGAIEQSSNMYFSLLASEHMQSPLDLEKTAKNLSIGSKTGIDLPGEIKGSIPDDLEDNKTGLYSFAIGQHSLIATPLQTAVMYGAFATKNAHILKPQVIKNISGEKKSDENTWLSLSSIAKEAYAFQEPLALAGIHFPLFTEALSRSQKLSEVALEPEVKQSLFLPSEIRSMLLDGMKRVVSGPKGTAREGIIRYLKEFPLSAREFRALKGRYVGKTGTAEVLYKPWIDAESLAEIRNHIRFAGIVFPSTPKDSSQSWPDGDLVVAVFLNFSRAGGKEAAPIGSQVAAKWYEIQKKYSNEEKDLHSDLWALDED